MLDAVQEGVYHTDLERRILHWNLAARRITGHSSEAVTSIRCQDRIVRHVDGHGRELCSSSRCPLLVSLQTQGPHQADLFLHHQEGHLVPVSVRTQPFHNDEGILAGLTLVFQERMVAKTPEAEEWKKAALTDALTGLGNRRAFRQAWARAHRALVSKGAVFGVLMIDVDRFKAVNDTHGHGVGDRVLKMVSRTLVSSVREKDLVVRWGGEEFLLLVSSTDLSSLNDLAERVRKLVERAWVPLPDGKHLSVTVSVGGALVQSCDTPSTLVARADARLFDCKAGGRNRSLTGN